ncbi:hypothetical protein [Burkholderia paludis]|uniref:hypothetical protein n=1 Tax=Burkholderia paludis TaxID=1506587 RepID=UPI000AA99C08|nr:hypothetical protein [Burkholderia paludis]
MLEQRFLDVVLIRLETEIPAHGQSDERRRKPMNALKRLRLLHPDVPRYPLGNVPMPSPDFARIR